MIKISLVGDLFPSNSTYTKKCGYGSLLLNDSGSYWENRLYSLFRNSDITFGNLEVPLISDPEIVHNSSFAGSIKFAGTLKKSGFDIVSVANNHMLGYGIEGFNSTKKALIEEDVSFVGVYTERKSNIVVFERNNLKFGFAGFNAIYDIANPSLLADLEIENVKGTLDEMKKLKLDYKLLSFHWGNEYSNIPSYSQIETAHMLIDYGADVIVGHHPHVIQPIERYKNGIIIYSLGNFIFEFLFSKQFKTGILVELSIHKDRKIDFQVKGLQLDEKKLYTLDLSGRTLDKLKKYTDIMIQLHKKGQESYQNHYIKALKLKHTYQRILMKRKLLNTLLLSGHRRQVFRNILNRIYSTSKI